MRLNRLVSQKLFCHVLLVAGVVVGTAGGAFAAPAGIEGTHVGDWFNDTFSSEGAASIIVEVNGDMVTFTFDMDGFVFGFIDPDPVVIMGTIVGDNIVIDEAGVTTFGDISGTINCTTGDVSFALTMIPGFIQIVVTGTATASGFNLDYTIAADPGPDMFVGRLITVPEPGSAIAGAAAILSLAGLRFARERRRR